MPAFVNRRFGESGMRLDEGTMVCCFSLKKLRNDWRIWAEVMAGKMSRKEKRVRAAWQWRSLGGEVV
jgi:hypothetical protein